MTSVTIPDEKHLRRLLRRAVAEIIPEEEFAAALRTGRRLRLKMGLDPSAPDLTLGHAVALVPGARTNIKITGPDDLAIAEALLARGAGQLLVAAPGVQASLPHPLRLLLEL